MQMSRASTPPAPSPPLEDPSMRVLEGAVAALAIAAAILLSLAR